jgi:putative colanic acid biosynthesis UDP-glucose lipid carrier transferase
MRSQLSASALVRITLDPLIIIGTLLTVALVKGETFEGPYLVLSLIVFSLTFPASPPQAASLTALAREVVSDWLAIVGILLFFGWATHSVSSFPQDVLVAWVIAVPFVSFLAHSTMPIVLKRLLAADGARRTAIIIGAGESGQKLAQQFRGSPFHGIRFAGFFDDCTPSRLHLEDGEALLGKTDVLPAYVKANAVDMIFITLPMASQPRIMRLLDELRDTTASVYFAPDIFLFDLIQARMDNIGGVPIVAVCETPFYGVAGLTKRVSDIVIATIILLLIAPLMLCIAIAVKLESPGTVLFKQRRYGLDGKEIIVYKFRSMTVSEDGGVIKQATKNDQRITRIGGFLRKSSLDELPQFINVLQGRMSVVGPRPHAVAHNELYRKLIKGYMIRHKVKPGITGWAQVNGLRGETETLDKMKARIEYDLAYLRNWSLRFDLAIILRTILVVLRDRNAY